MVNTWKTSSTFTLCIDNSFKRDGVEVECKIFTKNSLNDGEENLSSVGAAVINDDEHDYEFTFTGSPSLEKLNVSSIKLTVKATGEAFEWLNYPDDNLLELKDGEETIVSVTDNMYAGGSGTSDDPYLVANPRQLYNVREHTGSSFKQIADIDFAGSCGITLKYNGETGFYEIDSENEDARFYNGSGGFSPICWGSTFSGTYDGGGYTISNLVQFYGGTEVRAGLFGLIQDATLQNINLDATCACAGPEDARMGKYYGSLVGIVIDGCVL